MDRQLSIVPVLNMVPQPNHANEAGPSAFKLPRSKYVDPLTSFPCFSILPAEIRLMVWEFTLKPRTMELEWIQHRGFYSRVASPTALMVNRDSRNSVRHHYTLCFGNLMKPPRTLFNFKIDVLLLPDEIQHQTLQLFAGLRPDEMANLQYIAVSFAINEDPETGGYTDDDSILALSLIVPKLPALKEVNVAWELAYNYDGNDQGGTGPLKIFGPELPPDFGHVCGSLADWLDDMSDDGDEDDDDEKYLDFPDDLCDCNELPGVPDEFKIIKAPRMESVWSWRSTALP